MRFLFLFLLLIFTCIVKSQQPQSKNIYNGYFVSGSLKNASGATVYLEEISFVKEINTVDSTNADGNGNFSFNGKVNEPTLYLLRIKNRRDVSTLILENSSIHIRGNADSLGSVLITGSKETDLFNKANQVPELKRLNPMYANIFDAFVNTDTLSLNRIRQQIQLFLPDLVKSIKSFISTYPRAYISVALLNNLIDIDSFFPDLDALNYADSLIDFFKSTAVSNSTQLNYLDDLIKSRLAVSIGKYAPDIFQPDTSGKLTALSSFRGKYVLLDFWASWCLPCRKENLSLKETFTEYKDNFTIVSVSLDDSKSDWVRAIEKDGMKWINVSDLKADHNAAKIKYGIKGIPSNFLIDPDGKIIAKAIRGSELKPLLATLIK